MQFTLKGTPREIKVQIALLQKIYIGKEVK